MGKLLAFALIGYGVGMLLVIGIMAIGGLEVMVGLFLPIVINLFLRRNMDNFVIS
jgi:hypothetical protein